MTNLRPDKEKMMGLPTIIEGEIYYPEVMFNEIEKQNKYMKEQIEVIYSELGDEQERLIFLLYLKVIGEDPWPWNL